MYPLIAEIFLLKWILDEKYAIMTARIVNRKKIEKEMSDEFAFLVVKINKEKGPHN